MKKLIALLLCVTALVLLAACGATAPAEESAADALPTVLNQNEYVLYQNIFFNNQAESYLGKTVTKVGTFTRLEDAFGNVTRYYVWGYNDATKCCDWQWEFVPADPGSLPANGALVEMTGTLARDEGALDKLWFTDAQVTVKTPYQGPACDVDMTAMSATLERVQLANMQYKPDFFQGKSFRLYGRVMNPNTVQHPYYDNNWTQDFTTQDSVPAIGTMIILSGTWRDGAVEGGKVEETKAY